MITFKKLLFLATIPNSMVMLAQVSIGSLEVQQPTQQQSKPKTIICDSLTDFKLQENPQNYAQYKGHQFYLPPKIEGQKNTPILYSLSSKSASTNENDIYDQYYTLLTGIPGSVLKTLIIEDKLYNYHKESFTRVSRYPNLIKPIYFVMKNNKSGDTLYWSPTNKGEFIFVPYFIKQKSLYENKNYVCDNTSFTINELLNASHPEISMEKNSKWKCKEVTLLKYSQVNDYVQEDKYIISYIFTNDKNQTFAKEINPIYPDSITPYENYPGKFLISEQKFLKNEQERKKKEQELKLQNEAALAKQKQNEKELYQKWVKEYGQTNADLIKSGKVKIGMTKAMCIYAWGPFFTPFKTINDQGTFETFQYSSTIALYFENGVLKQIQQ